MASVLVLTLMLGLWSMLGVYRDLYAKGEEKAEQSQLVRSLAQILTDDLNSAIQDPATAVPKSGRGQTSARRFGLFGTDSFMRIDVLQIPPFPVGPSSASGEMELSTEVGMGTGTGIVAGTGDETGDETDAGTDVDGGFAANGRRGGRGLQAPELRTVYYTFVDPAYSAMNSEELLSTEEPMQTEEPEMRPGLTREELDFETPDPEAVSSDSELGSAIPDDLSIETAGDQIGRRSFDKMLEEEPDDSVMWAPEVVGLHFRYFDGRAWRSSWNSLQRKGLPVAVEVAMQISSFDGAEAIYRAAGRTDASVLGAGEGLDEFAGDEPAGTAEQGFVDPAGAALLEPVDGLADPAATLDLPRPRVHRVVIYLPSSPLYRPPRPARPASRVMEIAPPMAPPALPAPRVTTPRPASRPVSRRSFSDQWMRNQP